MESNFNNRDFEQFVKQNADQYRMFPSEKVWKGIDSALHTRRRWYGLGLALLLLLTGAAVTLVMVTAPSNKQQSSLLSPGFKNQPAGSATTEETVVPTAPQSGPISFDQAPSSRVTTAKETAVTLFEDILTEKQETIAQRTPDHTVVAAETSARDNLTALVILTEQPKIQKSPSAPLAKLPVVIVGLSTETAGTDIVKNNTAASKQTGQTADPLKKEVSPFTIESVANSFKKPGVKKNLSFLLYLAPTISYRKLSENKGFMQEAALNGYVPAFAAYSDVKNIVIHKPDLGLEAGVAARYPISKSFTLKGGLQFNVSRYDIKAYRYPGEIATIALDAGSGNNSISTATVYRTRSGSRSNWLQNLYYSASVPVGLEYKFNKRKSTYFALAATAQPTYVITNRAYLLSTDYKNYVEVPSLTRHWNMNAGFEAFVSYKNKSGNTRWQIGPQVRYQIKSSFVDTYPVKENLFDFGLKVGLILNDK
jgi:hypothetical protein